jgi:uncharacterized membrane protein YkoI
MLGRHPSLLCIRTLGVLLCALALTLASLPAAAVSDQDRARQAVEQGQALPLNAVLKSIKRQCKGRVLDAQLLQGGRGWIYRVRVLTREGKVVDLAVDAQSGQMIGGSGSCN